jgi:transcriptional regulator with XRE-family HTH domain
MRATAAPGLFPALTRHWRTRRGMSQLDLALAADVSSRHLSFLETGKAQPSREMVLRLCHALAVPLRDQNQLLKAAGHPEAFAEPGPEEALAGPIQAAVESMLQHQEPFPMVVMNRAYDVVRMNRGAMQVLGRMVADPSALGDRPNGFRVLFDPRGARPFMPEWAQVARAMLSRLHREALERPGDVALGELLKSLFAYPDVPADWRTPDLSAPSLPFLPIRLHRGDLRLAFLTTVTTFNAPQNVTLEELRLESYFPLDDETRRSCAGFMNED